MSTASASEYRWLEPPPRRTARFSSARHRIDEAAGGGGDPGEMPEEIEHRALGHQHGTRSAGQFGQRLTGRHSGSVAAQHLQLDRRIDQSQRERGGVEPGHDAGLAGPQRGAQRQLRG
jgi:hypothetical protein